MGHFIVNYAKEIRHVDDIGATQHANVLDVNSLVNTITDLNQYGIDVDHCTLDAGYYSSNNVENLNFSKIPFLLVLYRVDEAENTAYVTRVIYGSRDYAKLL